MLKHINKIISPELMKTMMEMGHGDEITITDGNFPALSYSNKIIRCEGATISQILEAILYYLPLDYLDNHPVKMMNCPKQVLDGKIVKERYEKIIYPHLVENQEIEFLERGDFYERANKSIVTIVTSDQARFANIIIRKGVVVD
jgi:L-fucose mutarotase